MLTKAFLQIVTVLIPITLTAATPKIYSGSKPSWVTKRGEVKYQPKKREVKDGFYLKQSEQQVHVEKKSTYNRFIREIVSEAGIQNGSEISIRFDPSYEKVEFHEILVWRNGKALNRLSLSKFKILANEQELSKFIYRGSYDAYLILEDIRKGDRIECSYTITGRNPIFGDKYSSFFYLQDYNIPISNLYISLIASQDRYLKFKYFNSAPEAKKTIERGLVRYEWERSRLKALEYEEEEPSWFNLYPIVQVSEYRSWAEVVQWAALINPPATALKGELGKRIYELKTKFGNDPATLFREAVKIVQNEVRYMGVEMGQYSHKANAPQQVFDQRFGERISHCYWYLY